MHMDISSTSLDLLKNDYSKVATVVSRGYQNTSDNYALRSGSATVNLSSYDADLIAFTVTTGGSGSNMDSSDYMTISAS